MSGKRFSLKEWEDLNYCEHCFYDGKSQLSDSDVVVLLNKQQATIRKLQDLCGESDSENAKLRIENKRLAEENRELRQSVEYWQKKYEEGTETFQID